MSNHNQKRKLNLHPGFTLVEMLIIAPIVILMIGIFISAIVSMTGDVLATRASNSMAYNIQDALNRIQSDVNLSGSFLATNNINVISPQGYNDNDATPFHNANSSSAIGQILILNTYATTSNPTILTRNIVYISNQPNSCSNALVNQNQPLMMNIVYFVKNNTLWRRVIAPANYATTGCVNGSVDKPWQQPSCSATATGTMCVAKDEKLVDNIQSGGFCVSYFTTPGANTSGANACNDPLASSTANDGSQTDNVRQAALQTASTISVTISAANTIAGRDITQSGTIRSISPNNNTSAYSDTVTNGAVVNLDSGNPASYSGSGSTWTNLSNNTYNATLQNTPLYNSGNIVFNGANNYVSLPSKNWYSANGFSISAWVINNDFSGTFERIIDFGNGVPSDNIIMGRLSTGTGTVFWQDCSGTTCYSMSIPNVLVAGVWTNLVGTIDPNGTLKLYKDGSLVGVTSGVNVTNVVINNNYIGRSNWSGDAYWDGKMSNIQIYNRSLTGIEIQQNFNAIRYRYGI